MREFDATEYMISITYVYTENQFGGTFRATIKELPDVYEYSDDPCEAYYLAIDTIRTAREVFKNEGRLDTFPKPSMYQAIDDIVSEYENRSRLHRLWDRIVNIYYKIIRI